MNTARPIILALAFWLLAGGVLRAIPISQPEQGSQRFPPGMRVGKAITFARPVRSVACGEDHTLALHDNGTVSAWGLNQFGQCDVPADLPAATMVAAGTLFSAALLKDGRIVTWGQVDSKHFADVRARSIAASETSFGVVRQDGSVRVWRIGDGRVWILKGKGHDKWAGGFKNARQLVLRFWEGSEPTAILAHWEGLDRLVFRRLPGVIILDEEGSAHFMTEEGKPKILAKDIAQISGGSDRIVAVTKQGELRAWGTQSLHRHAAKLGKMKLLAAGYSYTIAVTEKGDVLGAVDNEWQKHEVPGGEIVSIAMAPAYFSFLIYKSGMMVPIGADYAGQASLPSKPCKILKTVTANQHTIALRSDGSAVGWCEYWDRGWGESPSDSGPWYAQSSIPLGLGKIQDVTTGENFTMLLMRDGSLIGWGNARGGVFDLPASAKHLRTIVSGDHFAVALDRAGKVHAWGDNRLGQCDVPKSMGKVTQITADGNRAHALNSDGTVFSWGDNYTDKDKPGAKPHPGELRDVVAISAGYTHALALRKDGSVIAWGRNRFGQCDVPKNLKPCKAICAGAFVSVAIERETGKAIVWGEPGCEPPEDLPPLISVSAGLGVMIGTTESGSLVGWGSKEILPAAYSIPVGLTGLP